MELIVENRSYQFTCEQDSPIGHVKETLVKFLQRAGEIEDQIIAAQEKAKAEEKAKQDKEASQELVEAASAA